MSFSRLSGPLVAAITLNVLTACAGGGGSTFSSGPVASSDSVNGVSTIRDLVRMRVRSQLRDGSHAGRVFGWLSPDSKPAHRGDELLYASDLPNVSNATGSVLIFKGLRESESLHQVGQISGLDSPSELAVDRSGNLYVVQTDIGAPVLVFAPGTTHPMRSLDTAGALPISVAIDEAGNTYVGVLNAILEYAPGATKPTRTISGPFGDGVASLNADRDGNIYFTTVFIDAGGGVLGELLGGVTPIANLSFPDSPLYAHLMETGAMTILPLAGSSIDTFARGSTTLTSTFQCGFSTSFAFDPDERFAFVAGAGTLTTFAYPSGKLLRSLALGGPNDSNFGLATFPVKHLPKPF